MTAAAATIVASERAVERLGLKPLARIIGYAQAEIAPKWLFLAPVEGVKRLADAYRSLAGVALSPLACSGER